MEPLSALSVATAAIQFIDFTANIVSETLEIRHSASGITLANSEIEVIAKSADELSQDIDEKVRSIQGERPLTKNERAIRDIGRSCQTVAQDLQNALSDLKYPLLRGSHAPKVWSSVRQAVKSVWYQGRIEDLEKRLDKLRQQLIFQLLFNVQDWFNPYPKFSNLRVPGATKTIEEKLADSTSDSTKWQSHFIQTVYRNNWSPDDDEHTAQTASLLSNLSKNDRHDFLRTKLLHQLSFYSMKERHADVAEAHKRTFEWIYEDLSPTNRRWDSFPEWLGNDAPIYWITGKAGSGKSTLMKFLGQDVRTTQLLQRWARDIPLVVSAFYFWNSGVNIQMSQGGLLRTLLHGALAQCSQLIPKVFPSRWDTYLTFGGDSAPWTMEELLKAFKILISHHGTTAKFCFFIDGLDEFDGEHDELVEYLQDVVSAFKVKVCVSSRPWLVFEDALKCNPSLHLQDLTYGDITYYVSDQLLRNPTVYELNQANPDYVAQIVDRVAQKASGVFLWVHLVVKSLRKGISNGDRVSDMKRRLDDLPAGLEELFRKMLDSIEPFYFEHASQLFQLVRAAVCPLSVLTMAFADEEDNDAVFELPVQPLAETETYTRVETIRRRINSRCKGFLEVVPVSPLGHGSDESVAVEAAFESLSITSNSDAETTTTEVSQPWLQYDAYDRAKFKVQYLHRSAKDYLAKPEVWRRITSATASTSFNAHLALCRAFIMLLKTLKPHSLNRFEFWYVVWMVMEHAAQVEAGVGDCPVDLIDELDRAAIELTTAKRPMSLTFLQTHLGSRMRYSHAHWTMTRPLRPSNTRRQDGLFHLAVQCGLVSYIQSKLGGKDKAATETCTDLLSGALRDDKNLPSVMKDTMIALAVPKYDVLTAFLDLGADPTPSWSKFWTEAEVALQSRNPKPMNREEWISLVVKFVECGVTLDRKQRKAVNKLLRQHQ